MKKSTIKSHLKMFLLFSGMLAFVLNYAIESLFGASSYILGGIFILAGFALSKKRDVYSIRVIIVLSIVMTSIVVHFWLGYFADGFFEAFLCYVGFPTIAYLILNNEHEQDSIIKFVAITGIISFIGAIFFYCNLFYDLGEFQSIFNKIERTITLGQVQLRNSSIYGSSLVAGGLSLVQASCCVYLLKKGYSKIWLLVFLLCVAVILASLSRRAYVPLIIVIYYLIKDWNPVSKIIFFVVLIMSFGLLAYMSPDLIVSMYIRYASIFDWGPTFTGGNESRLLAILFGFSQILDNPIGTGFGSLSSIGKDIKDISSGADIEGFLGITESFYVTLVGELGLLQSAIILIIFIGKYHMIFKDLRLKIIFLPLCIESILGLSLLNPQISLLSLMCVLPMIKYSEREGFYKNSKYIKSQNST